MKVIKIIHRAIRPNDDGKFLIWVMAYINGRYSYNCMGFDTLEEANAVDVGTFIPTSGTIVNQNHSSIVSKE